MICLANVHVTHYEAWNAFERGELRFQIVDPTGVMSIPDPVLTAERTATTRTGFTLGFIALNPPKSYVT